MKKRLLVVTMAGLSVLSLAYANSDKVSTKNIQVQAKRSSNIKPMILLRARPSNTGRVIARFSPEAHLVAFYKKGDWYKAGDPKTGEVGWYNQQQAAKVIAEHFKPPVVNFTDYSITVNKQGDKPAKIVAYRNGKKLNEQQAQAFYKQLKQQSKQENHYWQQQMNVMQHQFNDMMQFNDSLFNSYPVPVIQPVIIIEKPQQTSSSSGQKRKP